MGYRYNQPLVGVGCVVIDRGSNILMVKRRNPPGAGKWSIPGGHLEIDEDIFHAAVRELEEETGIRARPMGVVYISEVFTSSRHYVILDVLMEPIDSLDSAVAGSDVEAVGVFGISEALNLDLTPSVRGLIEYIAGNIDVIRYRDRRVLDLNIFKYD